MVEVIQVREYETITCADDDRIEYGDHRLPKKYFDDLIHFVKEYVSKDDSSDVLEFVKIGYKRHTGDVISFKNYVGMIQTSSGFQIEILPKIEFVKGQNSINETKRIFLKMIRTMRDFEGKSFKDAYLKADRMNLFYIFINMYLQEVRRIVKSGIKSGYIRREENANYYKGKLLVNEHICNNITHKERFYISYDEFHPNRPENRLIKSTLIKLRNMTKNTDNTKEIFRLLSFFGMVKPSINYQKDFARVVINRNIKNYQFAMQWSKVFLLNKSFTTFSGEENSKTILFPMETVYESYVARELKKVMSPLGWNITTQDKRYYLFELPRKRFALKPDIVLFRGDRCVVLDTKWKALVDNPASNYGISQSDMYQMFAYSKKYKTSEIWLLYPMSKDFVDHDDIWYISDENTDTSMNVRVFFIDLSSKECFEELGRLIDTQSILHDGMIS